MLKRIMVVLLAFLFQSGVGYAKPELGEVKAFRIYHEGMEKGELIFMVIGDKAIYSSPFGVNYIAMNQFDEGSIVFGSLIELAWVIHDVWDNDKQGYRCVVNMKNAGVNTVGYAKPVGRFDSRRSRSLAAKSSFRFFGLKGYVDVYDLSTGKRTDGGRHDEFSQEMVRCCLSSLSSIKGDFTVTRAQARSKYSAMICQSCSLRLLQGETSK